MNCYTNVNMLIFSPVQLDRFCVTFSSTFIHPTLLNYKMAKMLLLR